MSDDFEKLLRLVVAETGTFPISYVKVTDANVIAMTLPPPHGSTDGEGRISMTANFAPDRNPFHDAPEVVVPQRSLTSTPISKYHLIMNH